MLDNMTTDEIRKTVALVDVKAILEASGGVYLNDIMNLSYHHISASSNSLITLARLSIAMGFWINLVTPAASTFSLLIDSL